MNLLGRLAIVLALLLAVTSPVLAQLAVIQTSAPLADHSEQSIETAFEQAIRAALQAAVAAGLPWVQLRLALVREDRVTVEVLAMETDLDQDEEGQEDKSKDEPEAGEVRT